MTQTKNGSERSVSLNALGLQQIERSRFVRAVTENDAAYWILARFRNTRRGSRAYPIGIENVERLTQDRIQVLIRTHMDIDRGSRELHACDL